MLFTHPKHMNTFGMFVNMFFIIFHNLTGHAYICACEVWRPTEQERSGQSQVIREIQLSWYGWRTLEADIQSSFLPWLLPCLVLVCLYFTFPMLLTHVWSPLLSTALWQIGDSSGIKWTILVRYSPNLAWYDLYFCSLLWQWGFVK